MRLIQMRGLKLIATVSLAVIAAVTIGIWRASTQPQHPDGWPEGAIWVHAPGVHFSLVPKGVWQGCWLDSKTGRDHCKFADYQGRVLFESEYLICSEKRGVPDESLWLKPSTSTFIYLRDGTMLMEVSLCEARNKGIAEPSGPPK